MFITILLLCSCVFIGIGIFALYKKSPMWFWADTEHDMKCAPITNIKEFNRKNGIMWIVFGSAYLIPALLRWMYSFPDWILGIFLTFISVAGTIAMMLYWEHLNDTYRKH